MTLASRGTLGLAASTALGVALAIKRFSSSLPIASRWILASCGLSQGCTARG